MAKAFDSVGMYSLKKAMERLALPPPFIELIKDTFDQRMISVITAHGITEAFTAGDGID